MSRTVFPLPEVHRARRVTRFAWYAGDPHPERLHHERLRHEGHDDSELARRPPNEDPWFRELAKLAPREHRPRDHIAEELAFDEPSTGREAGRSPELERATRLDQWSDRQVLGVATANGPHSPPEPSRPHLTDNVGVRGGIVAGGSLFAGTDAPVDRGVPATATTRDNPSTDPVPRNLLRPALPGRRRHLLDELKLRCSDPRLRAVALGLVAIAAGVFWYVSGTSSPGSTGAHDDAVTAAQAAAEEAGADDSPSVLTIHVAGEVAEPGVVELVAGSRIIDALEAVGGATPAADLDQLNLAAALDDGQRILVPAVGEVLPADASGAVDAGGADGGLLDLNSATKTQLEELPGIGPVLAESIIDDRDSRGGYRAVEDLRGVSGIGEKRFEDIKDLVTVR